VASERLTPEEKARRAEARAAFRAKQREERRAFERDVLAPEVKRLIEESKRKPL